MKRSISGPGPDQRVDDSSPNLEHIPCHTDGSTYILHRPLKRGRLDTPSLTQETLAKLHCPIDRLQSVRLWTEYCSNGEELDMPPSLNPSVALVTGNQRRLGKPIQGQLFPSPAKKASSLQYRVMNMADANLFVDHFSEAPATIDAEAGRIFDKAHLATNDQETIHELAMQYCNESRASAKKCVGENEWKSLLFLGLLRPLSRLEPDVLMLSASGKPWVAELKPTAPSLYNFNPCAPERIPATLQSPVTNTVLPNTPVFSLPSSSASDVSSESPNGLSTPKPDITLGLAHTAFTPKQRQVLMLLQDYFRVLSEPHQAQIGLRFPYFVVECKGGAAGGNLIGAQNQAAVDVACALNVLDDLQCIVSAILSQSGSDELSQTEREHQRQVVLFSLTTEGPIHEIWMHYRYNGKYHSTCRRAWRVTRLEDAREFVEELAMIVDWGRRTLRASIITMLAQIEEAVLGGILVKMDENPAFNNR